MSDRPPLAWLHFGDLHITTADAPNHRDFAVLVDEANRGLAGQLDFALLPGDSAENGTGSQFRLVRAIADGLRLPLRILPGDHDFEPGSLDAFHATLGAPALPLTERRRGTRCLFLDIVSAGSGGPDFRLDPAALDWLAGELAAAERAGEMSALFMHAYPADLRSGGAALMSLLGAHRVAVVDMGHTHYNELANDGRTIYAATRSTGQIEEGPPGFSVMAVDDGAVSWRFRPIGQAWPLVLVTSPPDERLRTALSPAPRALRALVLGPDAPRAVRAVIDDGPARAMTPNGSVWQVDLPALDPGLHRVTVQAETRSGEGRDTIRFAAGDRSRTPRHADGSDADRIGAWPERHLLGTQLGPNRYGRKW